MSLLLSSYECCDTAASNCIWNTPSNGMTCCASIEIQAKARNVTDILYRDLPEVSNASIYCNVSRLVAGQFCRFVI